MQRTEAYIPQMVSLGPYHHRSMQEEPMGPYHQRLSHLSQMDIYKLNSTIDATRNKPIEDFFRQIKEEAMMRNLLALEFNDANRPKHVTQYVELKDCLIDTPEDVVLLRECHVIDRHSMMTTDEYVAKIWDGMAKPMFFAGFLEHAQGLKAGIRETLIKNYYKKSVGYKTMDGMRKV
ncbi:hypothetical protein SUGI_0370540 [Cryptomeria japonica]|nr:hypothetical protein SUGI_0370540 [Cryptomeria japonica]